MSQRDYYRSSELRRDRSDTDGSPTAQGNPVLALQRAIGNRATTQLLARENSWVRVTFKNAVIRGYAPDSSGRTERWKATGFDAVDIKRTSIGKPRP